jgi:hypothetical protein
MLILEKFFQYSTATTEVSLILIAYDISGLLNNSINADPVTLWADMPAYHYL